MLDVNELLNTAERNQMILLLWNYHHQLLLL